MKYGESAFDILYLLFAYIAFYTGIHPMEIVEEQSQVSVYGAITDEMRAWVKYPLSQVYFRMAAHQYDSDEHNHSLLTSQTYDLSPANMKALYYGLNIDADTEFTITFKTNRVLDPTRIFLIRGRQFCCKQLKYKIRADGLYPVCEGVFHAIKQ